MRKIAAAAIALAVAATAAVAGLLLTPRSASHPSAELMCEHVYTNGTLIGSHAVNSPCVFINSALICQTETVGVQPDATVTADACVPAVLINNRLQ